MYLLRIQGTFVLLIASLCCLAAAIDDEEYGLIMARMPILYQEWALTKRDVCADAIPGTVTSTCTPGNTLCCTPNNTNVAFPQCQTILGSGYCCISENNCYIDTPSDCAAANSVPCSMLVSTVSEACCPPFTECPNNFNQSTTVRCNIVQNSASSSTSAAKSSSTTTSSSTSSSSSAGSSTSSAPTDNLSPVTQTSSSASPTGTGIIAASTGSSLSPGADAGIGVGVALVVLAIAALAFWAYQRGKKKGAAARAAEAQAALGTQITPGTEHQQYYDPTKYSDVPQYQQGFGQQPQSKSELPGVHQHYRPAELGGINDAQHELP